MRDVIYTDQLDSVDPVGRHFEAHGNTSSIIKKDRIFKSLNSWNSKEEAYQCLEIWRELGYSGAPSNPASFFREDYKKGVINASLNNAIDGAFKGGWIYAESGHYAGRELYLYDINSAYQWALQQGLPIHIHYASSKQMRSDPECMVLIHPTNRLDLPRFLRSKQVLVKNKDIDLFGIKGKKLDGFISGDGMTTQSVIFDRLKELLPETAYKKLTQIFWGIWYSTEPLSYYSVRQTGEVDKEGTMYNYHKNLFWAFLILNRIHRKLYQVYKKYHPCRIATDSIIIDRPMGHEEVDSNKIGKWDLEHTFKEGIFIQDTGKIQDLHTGSVDDDLRDWYKHSGVSK